NQRLISTLKNLRDRGNTVFVVEHDREMMLASDHLVDIGPGAGRLGGKIVAQGPIPEVIDEYDTATTAYLASRRMVEVPEKRRACDQGFLKIKGATQHNLNNLDVDFPLKTMIAVTGVSGSGKSTLVEEILVRALRRKLGLSSKDAIGDHKDLQGWESIERVINIDQSPIGRTPRSNPATYTKVFDLIREVFAQCPEARTRGYDRGRFSFNKKGGRCEHCGGAGFIEVEMQFLANVVIPCEECVTKRYSRETLEIRYRGKTIHDILEMAVEEALGFFSHHPKIVRILATLNDVGLGYIALGQSSTTLSGGEAQRVKLASELCRPSCGRTLYVLDEPTTGLHFDDIKVLLNTLNRLVDRGNTMVIIEHNLDVIKVADHVIDLGPEGGEQGGKVVACGPPEALTLVKESHTGQALRSELGRKIETGVSPVKRARKTRPPINTGHARYLSIRGARKNNLHDVDVDIPHNALTVITGVSGSGKSSLAFDTIFAEGQRRFVESLSSYARRFLSRLDKVPVDRIEGLAPAIAIDQRSAVRSPRSTVATATEIHDFLRLLYARVGIPHCPKCDKEIRAWSPASAAEDLKMHDREDRALITAPLFRKGMTKPLSLARAEAFESFAPELLQQGFLRVMINRETFRLDEKAVLPEASKIQEIDLVVDRVSLKNARKSRLAESIETAFRHGHGAAAVHFPGAGPSLFYLEEAGCLSCDFELGELAPRMFSFNSIAGACTSCEGIGFLERCGLEKLIVEPSKPLLAGAVRGKLSEWMTKPGGFVQSAVEALGRLHRFDESTPWNRLSSAAKDAVLHGEGIPGNLLTITRKKKSASGRREYTYDIEWYGLLAWVEDSYRNATQGWRRKILARCMETGVCPACRGGRLKPEVLAVTVGGKNIQALCAMSIDEATAFFKALHLEGLARTLAASILKEINNRLGFLRKVGLGYLTLDRSSGSLSGGEAQRIRLASQLGNRLAGVLYVLDEPTIGLHPRDIKRLLKTLTDLRDLGNTVVMVEHDRSCIEEADHLVDLGPGAGHRGGQVVYSGRPANVIGAKNSLTGRYLTGEISAASPAEKSAPADRKIGLRKAGRHNLQNVDVDFPLENLIAVTGVSGSGKSTMIMGLLREGLDRALSGRQGCVPGLQKLTGVQHVDKLGVIDQAPIGRTTASNAATYTKIFDGIRDIFAATPEARMRGFNSGHFSFNTGDGRCPACGGRGVEVIEMHFLSDVTLPCNLCRGMRYNRETLSVRYKGMNINDVLEMEINQAAVFFANHRRIKGTLDLLDSVGLGYLKLGQPATTLSGGEAQRVKLAAELSRPDTGRTVYLLDEPTTGLHFEDVRRLILVLRKLVERKNTVIVIEH
ncbi:MAG: excinuclease ABC subunit UvrA, partial [Planctomycetes bacterium]|nr:excinuclease ABC subunit UvrA [Planctomycetota bacterium]